MSKYTAIRTEEEVGILSRVGNQKRFPALFKERYSDFHVNEIDLNGKIVQLGSLEPPEERKSEISVDDSQICSWIPEDIRDSIGAFQKRLEIACSSKLSKSDKLWADRVEIKVTILSKEERTKIHKWLTNFDKVSSETIDKDGGEKYIVALYEAKNIRSKRRPATRAKYTHCTLYKEGVDTFEALGVLSKKLRIKPSLITFCGTKDKHGKTTQRISISNIDASRLAQISNESKSIKLGSYEYLPHHLRLGDLKGNHFKILLRNVLADSSEINAAVESLKSQGFINYFGLQRFGSYEVSTKEVGKSILQMKWLDAFDLILNPKSNDQDFMKKAKHEWFVNRDPVAAIKKLPPWHRSIESNLLHGLAKYYSKNDLVGAFMRIPRNSRHLYIHSFQSFLWNQVASYRVKEMGLLPVVGDIVYVNKEHEDFYVEEIDEDYKDESNNEPIPDRLPSRGTVKTLTMEDLSNHTIYDVLIPIQGSQIIIPENGTKNYYNMLLKEEGMDSDCFLKFKPISDQPKGAYRKLLIRPQNFSHKIILYNDLDLVDTFIPSELDKANVKTQNESLTSIEAESATGVGAESDLSTKDKKCAIVEFSLPSSSYATMALREIMLSSSENHVNVDTRNPDEGVKCEKPEDGDSQPVAKRRRK